MGQWATAKLSYGYTLGWCSDTEWAEAACPDEEATDLIRKDDDLSAAEVIQLPDGNYRLTYGGEERATPSSPHTFTVTDLTATDQMNECLTIAARIIDVSLVGLTPDWLLTAHYG